VRLIDNLFFDTSPGRLAIDQGILLEGPSLLYR